MEMWLEAAQEFENEVNSWLAEIPPEFRMPAPSDSPPPPPSTSALAPAAAAEQYLAAQRCELAAFAKSLILKAYTPLLKKNTAKASTSPHARAAQLACCDAAHVIINACHGLFQTFGVSRPSSYVFYSFGRQIFAAAVITASIVIQNPSSLVAGPAMKDLERALELMRDPIVANARGHVHGAEDSGGHGIGVGGESVHIVQLLHAKALEALRGGGSASGGGYAGSKRKHGELESTIPVGFSLPFVGGSLATGPQSHTASTPPYAGSFAPPPKSRLRSGTTGSRRGGAPTVSTDTREPSLSRQTRLSPGSMDPPPEPTSAATSSPVGAHGGPKSASASGSSGKTPSAKERRKASAYPAIGVRKRPTKSANGGSSSTASRSHAGDDSSDAASSTHASSVRGPPSISGGGEGGGGKSEAGSSRVIPIKKHSGLPSVSTSSFSDSPYRPPASLPSIGDVPTAASSSASTPLPQHPLPQGYGAMQGDPNPPPTSSYNTFLNRAPPGSALSSAGGEYLNPSAMPSTNNSPTGNSAYMNSSTPYMTGNNVLSMQQNDHHQQQPHSYDVSMGSANHSINMSPSVSTHSMHSHGHVPPSPHSNMVQPHSSVYSQQHHHQSAQRHQDVTMSSSQAHARSYGGQEYSFPLGNADHAMPYSTPGDSFLQANTAHDVDMKPFAQISTSNIGPPEIHSAPPSAAPWPNFHENYPSQGRSSGANETTSFGGMPSSQDQHNQHQHQQGQSQGQHSQSSFTSNWQEYSY